MSPWRGVAQEPKGLGGWSAKKGLGWGLGNIPFAQVICWEQETGLECQGPPGHSAVDLGCPTVGYWRQMSHCVALERSVQQAATPQCQTPHHLLWPCLVGQTFCGIPVEILLTQCPRTRVRFSLPAPQLPPGRSPVLHPPRTGLFEVWRVRFASSWTRYAIDSLHAVCLPQMCPSQTRRYGRGLQYWSDGLPTAPSHLPPKVLLLCRSWGACVPHRSQRLCQLEFWLLVGTTMLDRLWARGQTKCNTPLMLATSVFGRIHRQPCYAMAQLKSRLNIPWPNDAECMGHVWCHLLCWYPLFCDVESLAGYVRG